MTRVIRITEHRTAALPGDSFSSEQARRLVRFSKFVEIQPPLPGGGEWQLMSKGYVGAIRVDHELSILIEPKVPIGNLAKMLQTVFDLPVEVFEGSVRANTISELYEQLAAKAALLTLGLSRQGLHQEHVTAARDLRAVRGRIDIRKMIERGPSRTVPCHVSERTPDIWHNRLLLSGIRAGLDSGICSAPTQALLRETHSRLASEVRLVTAEQLPAQSQYTRLTERYRPAHQLCKLLIAGRAPIAESGDAPTVPFLLNMPRLFEAFVAAWLRPPLEALGFSLGAQVHHKVGQPREVEFRIDLVVRERTTNRSIIVMDTKYKILDRPISADLAQVGYYALLEKCGCAGLITPELRVSTWSANTGGVATFMAGFDLSGDLEKAGRQFLATITPHLPKDSS